jgi:hypothetical protein
MRRGLLGLGLSAVTGGLALVVSCGLSTQGSLTIVGDAQPMMPNPADGGPITDAPSSDGQGSVDAPRDSDATPNESGMVDSGPPDSPQPGDAGSDQDAGCSGVLCRGTCFPSATNCAACADPYLCKGHCLQDCTTCNSGVDFVACAVCYDGGGVDAATLFCGPNDPNAFCLNGNYPHCACQSNSDCAPYQHCSGNTTCKSCGESSTGGHCQNGNCCVQSSASCTGAPMSC